MSTLGLLQMSDNGAFTCVHPRTSYHTIQALEIGRLCCFALYFELLNTKYIKNQQLKQTINILFNGSFLALKGCLSPKKTPFSKQNTALKGCEHTPKMIPNCMPNYVSNSILWYETSKSSQPLPYHFSRQKVAIFSPHLIPD